MKIFLAVLLVALSFAITPSSHASGLSSCRDLESVNGFIHLGDAPEFEDLFTTNLFEIRMCQKHGMRLIKAYADTAPERLELRTFGREIEPKKFPVLYCRKGNRGVLVDLAFFWQPGIKSLNQRERGHYSRWATSYAKKNHCKVYR